MKVTSCRRPRLPRTAVKALHRRSFFYLNRTEPAYPIGGSRLNQSSKTDHDQQPGSGRCTSTSKPSDPKTL